MKVINKYYYPNPAKHCAIAARNPIRASRNIALLMEYVQTGKYLPLVEEINEPPHDTISLKIISNANPDGVDNLTIVKSITNADGVDTITKFKVHNHYTIKDYDKCEINNIYILIII